MGDSTEPSSDPSSVEPSIHDKSSNKKGHEKKIWEPFRLILRKQKSGLSHSIDSLDLAQLKPEGERVDRKPPGSTPDDCSTSTEECKESATSETTESEQSCPKTSTCTDSKHHQTTSHWRGFLPSLKKNVVLPGHSLTPLIPKLSKKKSKRSRNVVAQASPVLDFDSLNFKSSWKNFTLSELQEATDDFSTENLIGQGGYAEVYKGELQGGKFVAIKRLTRGSPEEMTMDFLSELGIIVHVDHPNIAKMIGYGVEGGMHLVLQLSPHGSLASLLYGPKEKLTWRIRFKIGIGAAEGLSYLHEGCQRRIIHKDIKAANVLLTEAFDAQIADFGLAKWLPDQWTHLTVSTMEGTFGYLPPEFFMYGIVNEKTDVFAYGVLLLELITGRQAVDSSQHSLVMWAKPLIKQNKIKELVDPSLGDGYELDQLNRVIATASICIDQSPVNRPEMSQVVAILKGDIGCLEMLKEKSVLNDTDLEDICDDEDYNSAKHLSELNRQIEILLENPTDDTL